MATRRRGPPKGGAKKKKVFVKRGNERYDRHDAYYKKAKREGYVARSVYKLEEIDEQYKLLRPSDAVLDLGCAPGSWLQYVTAKLDAKKGGVAVGIDLLPTHTGFPSWVETRIGDIYDEDAQALLPEGRTGFDVVLSDMAPNTTGVRAVDQARSMALCEHALYLAETLLVDGGRFCVKVLEGGDMPQFLNRCRGVFETVKIRRPKGTRDTSSETYVIGLSKKAAQT